jgi:hypothetical protein
MRTMSFRFFGFWSLVLLTFLALASFSWAQRQSDAIVVKATKHVLAPALSKRTLTSHEAGRVSAGAEWARFSGAVALERDEEMGLEREEEESHVLDQGTQLRPPMSAPDSVRQELVSGSTLGTNPGVNFLGIGTGLSGCNQIFASSDTNGAVGPTQFVQWVNYCFAVFNKTNGSLEYGPVATNTLWKPLGSGPCYSNDNLDPIVQFDKLANRWVMMMPVFVQPAYLCIAVSTTSDAVTGGWNLYQFPVPRGVDPDYPKLGVWPDGYYVTFNQFTGKGFIGAAACALDRNDMLTGGTAATMQCFTTMGASYGAMLPGDLDGTTAPPVGSPNYFLNFDGNYQSLDLWQFHVNWTTPTLSTFTGPTNIAVSAFSGPCGDIPIINLMSSGGACIAQAGTTQLLNSYGDRLMYRLAYRNLGSHQSLVVNHAVNTGSSGNNSGIRWYELQNTGSGFTLYQQGTYAPDSNSRWMGSIAMDKAGDIALGYSISSTTMSPSIRYTGRVPTDPLGTMESEIDLLSSQGITPGSQSGAVNWGDYSSMAIDSTDDCTFWYTTEYQPTTGHKWSTRIASFSFPSCTNTAPPNWTIVNKGSGGGHSVTSLTIPSTGTGNLIAFAVMFNGSASVSSVSDNGGNTYVSAGARASSGPLSVEIWYAASSNPGATVITPTFTSQPPYVLMTEWEVSGLSTSHPDVTNIGGGSVTSNTLGPAVTTTATGDFVISAIYAGGTSFSGISSGNDFTNDFNTGGNGWAHLTSNTTSPGLQQASWSTSNPVGKYIASTVAFFAAP